MPAYVVSRTAELLATAGKDLAGAHVLVLGTAYKRDVGDHRESPAGDVVQLLADAGAKVSYHDPSAGAWAGAPDGVVRVPDLDAGLAACDVAVLLQDHSAYDLDRISELAPRLLDTRGRTTSAAVDRL